MSQPIDVAFVVIAADTDPLEKDLKKVVDTELKKFEREVNKTTKKIDEDFKDLGKNIGGVFERIVTVARNAAFKINEHLGDAFIRVEATMRRQLSGINSMFGQLTNLGQSAAEFFQRRVLPMFQRAGEVIGNLASGIGGTISSALTSIASSFSTMAFIVGALILAIPALTAVLISLGAVLANVSSLIFALPAGLSVLAAIIAPVVIGFQNFGEALGAIMAGDPEQIAEALTKLAGPAQFVAREFQTLLPVFRDIQRGVQSALFQPLIGDLTLLAMTLRGPLRTGLEGVAFSFGTLLSNISGLAVSAEGVKTLNLIFATATTVLNSFGEAFKTSLGPTFLKLIQATLPIVNKLLDKFLGFLVRIADKLSASIDDGSFNKFLEKALESLDGILALSGAIIDFFGALFTPTTLEAGQEILKVFTTLFTYMAQFLQTQEGAQALEDFATVAVFTAQALSGLIIIIAALIRTVVGLTAIILDFFNMADRTIVKVTEFGEAVGSAGDEIVRLISEIPGRLLGFAGDFLDSGLTLVRSFFAGFSAAGGFIANIAGDITGAIKRNLNRFIGALNAGIAGLDATLPFSLARIPSLADGGISPATPGGRIVRVSEAGEDEAIIPLSRLDDVLGARDNEAGPTITFGPDSIQVNFVGAVPTADEARQAGSAVAAGIISTLQRRDIRAEMRAR